MVVDNLYSTVGSTNLDQRSFSLNSEVNAFFIDENMAENLKRQFEEDLQDSYPLLLNSLKNRPWYKKALSSLARLFAPIL
jgi:cardiolipin synthase